MNKKGFTLIELLVVIAIIGILASVVLASLNSARTKGTDASVKANLANSRAQAQLYYEDNNSSFVDVCTSTDPKGIGTMLDGAASAGGWTVVTDGALQTTSTVNCYSNADEWVASSPLKTTSGDFFCVDSAGVAATTSTPLAENATVCTI